MNPAESVRLSMQYEAGLMAGEQEFFQSVLSSPAVSPEAKREVAVHFERRHRIEPLKLHMPTNPAGGRLGL